MASIEPELVETIRRSLFGVRLAHIDHIFRLACLAAAIILVTCLFWLGAKPVAVGLFPEPIDKIAHFATFGLIASMLWLSVLRGKPFLVIAIVSAVGAAGEFHQRFLPGRSAVLDDLAMDIFAALVVTALLELARRRAG